MSVTAYNELADGTWGPKWSADGTRTYQRTLEAFTDNANDTGLEVVQAIPITQFVSKHPRDSKAYATEVDAKQDEDDAKYWRLTYSYSTRVPEFAQGAPAGAPPGGGGPGSSPQHPTNPLDRRPVVKLRTKVFKKHIIKDLDGVLIANRAGDPYETTTYDVRRLVIDVTRNIPNFEYDLVNECAGGVNVSEFIGYEPRQVYCDDLSADAEWQEDIFYWKVHGVFVVALEDDIVDSAQPRTYWYDWRLNAGYHQLIAGVRRQILIDGQRPARPQLLTLAGALAAVGSTPIYNGFRVIRDSPFNALMLFD